MRASLTVVAVASVIAGAMFIVKPARGEPNKPLTVEQADQILEWCNAQLLDHLETYARMARKAERLRIESPRATNQIRILERELRKVTGLMDLKGESDSVLGFPPPIARVRCDHAPCQTGGVLQRTSAG